MSFVLEQHNIEKRLERWQAAREAAGQIKCPECGHLVYDIHGGGYEDHPVSYWGDELHDLWCDECDHQFQVRERVERSFEIVT